MLWKVAFLWLPLNQFKYVFIGFIFFFIQSNSVLEIFRIISSFFWRTFYTSCNPRGKVFLLFYPDFSYWEAFIIWWTNNVKKLMYASLAFPHCLTLLQFISRIDIYWLIGESAFIYKFLLSIFLFGNILIATENWKMIGGVSFFNPRFKPSVH